MQTFIPLEQEDICNSFMDLFPLKLYSMPLDNSLLQLFLCVIVYSYMKKGTGY